MGFDTRGLNDVVASLCAYSGAGSEERSFEGVHFGKQHIQMTLQDGSGSEVGSMQAASSEHVSQKALARRASVIPILPRASGTQQQGEAQLPPQLSLLPAPSCLVSCRSLASWPESPDTAARWWAGRQAVQQQGQAEPRSQGQTPQMH